MNRKIAMAGLIFSVAALVFLVVLLAIRPEHYPVIAALHVVSAACLTIGIAGRYLKRH